MRVAILSAHFYLGRSYQENVWAEELARMGHEVRAFHAAWRTHAPNTIDGPTGRYEVQKIATLLLPFSIFSSRALAAEVCKFAPDIIVAHGQKQFSNSVVHDRGLAHVPIISTYSENLGMHEFDWRKPGISLRQRIHALGFTALRARYIRWNCQRSDLIVGNTPQSRDLILDMIPPANRAAADARMIEMTLGFSPQHFRFDPVLRKRVRAELGLAEGDVVVCTSSRFRPIKAASIRLIVRASQRVMNERSDFKSIIVGFEQGDATSAEIAREIDRGPCAERFIKEPIADRARLNEVFNASDIIAYNLATVSCQEALGTGLVACFADIGAMHHLLTEPHQGVLYKPNDEEDLAGKLTGLATWWTAQSEQERRDVRRQLANSARWLGYDRIIASVVEQALQRTGKAGGIQAFAR